MRTHYLNLSLHKVVNDRLIDFVSRNMSASCVSITGSRELIERAHADDGQIGIRHLKMQHFTI